MEVHRVSLPYLRQKSSGTTPAKTDGSVAPSWADVHALFERDDGFVRRERERFMEEAAATMPEGWRDDQVSRAWVASYRLSIFETRRQAQRFFSWAIPDERWVGSRDCRACLTIPLPPRISSAGGKAYAYPTAMK